MVTSLFHLNAVGLLLTLKSLLTGQSLLLWFCLFYAFVSIFLQFVPFRIFIFMIWISLGN